MSIKVSIKQIVGYFLIYAMLLLNQTYVSELFLKSYTIPITIIFGVLLCVKSRRLAKWSMLCCGVLLVFVVLLRLATGGIGLEAYFSICVFVVVSSYVVAYNKADFLERFVKVVVFFAVVSLLLWAFCLTFPKIYEAITYTYDSQMKYRIFSTSTIYEEHSYQASGLFLYVMREIDQRNTGIFTEPGVYQMVLLTALFAILFLDKYMSRISENTRKTYIIILLITLLTTQSTTGYIGGCLIALFYVFDPRKELKSAKKTVMALLIFAVLLLVGDYNIRGDDSLLSVAIVEKLVTKGNEISVLATESGEARVGTIIYSFVSMIEKPLGVGYDSFYKLLNVDETGYVGAAILSFGAVWGIIPLLFVLWWMFFPVVKSQDLKIGKWLFVLLFLNTCLAQSSVFYPAIIVIPLFLFYIQKYVRAT